MQDQHGDDEGKRVFYATANKQGRKPETWSKTSMPHDPRILLAAILCKNASTSTRPVLTSMQEQQRQQSLLRQPGPPAQGARQLNSGPASMQEQQRQQSLLRQPGT